MKIKKKKFYSTHPTFNESREHTLVSLGILEQIAIDNTDKLRVVCPFCCAIFSHDFYSSSLTQITKHELINHCNYLIKINITNNYINKIINEFN